MARRTPGRQGSVGGHGVHGSSPWMTVLVLLNVVVGAPAWAQVTVNPGALDLLPSQPAARPAARPARPAPRPASPAKPETAGPAAPSPVAASPAAAPGKPTLPTIPPAIAALPPPAPVPPPRPQPAPVVPVAADAPGAASPVAGGVRVTFGPTRQDLNPTTEAALRELARRLKTDDQATVNIYAYASGTPEDISTARRVSLARALAARAVLINEGIASTRIYPRSLGLGGGETDRDRVDVVTGPPGPPIVPPPIASQPLMPASVPAPAK